MDNIKGIALMIAAMGGFALEDMFVKAVSASLPTSQILILLGTGGTLIFAGWARARGAHLFAPAMFTRAMWLRNAGEVAGTVCFVSAITLAPLSTASAILQATPLAVTLGAALFLGAPVGWRRWTAILAGFAGVLLVVRPGLAGSDPAALLAVAAVFGLAARDLCTRVAPPAVSSLTLSAYGFAMATLAGVVLLPFGGGPVMPDGATALALVGALCFGVAGYYAITAAMRVGEVAVVTPFRFSRLIFALILGMAVFGERPDAPTLLGAAIIIASGLYTLLREQRLASRRKQAVLP
ncbi:EamA family transporter [Meridianimarinicoccus roseus]|uniref:EamA family transporter n=1 Tax=Meridianimarinicoccus roseus TaxID=2072018 RepID=A0A2V2LDS5_9RHOB|nr:DMT family transporter [Meridianimarinicoccus roseus]PWR03212.1 EamA family transporter [Meridianimarinicoccus roseus]